MAVAPLPLGKEEEEIQTKEINALGEMNISRKIIFYANQEALRPIALCYRDFESWPPHGVKLDWDGDVSTVPYLLLSLFSYTNCTVFMGSSCNRSHVNRHHSYRRPSPRCMYRRC
jgi:hypothetical protein